MSFFSTSYHEALEKFHDAANHYGLRQTRFRIPHELNPDLFVDFAFVKRDPAQLLIHISGVHGIEGYLGSAVQSAILHEPLPPGNASLLFIHAVNPYGMMQGRRANAENVDLNRSYSPRGRKENPDYAFFDTYLNPKNKIQFFTGTLSGLLAKKRLGPARTTQAVASGQDSHPAGLFYMGKRIQREVQVIQEILRSHFAEVKKAVAIDLHSGLGNSGEEMLFVDEDIDPAAPGFFARHFGRKVSSADPATGIYINQGRFSGALRDALPGANLHYVLQEMGTYPASRVLRALRRENYEWHKNGPLAGAGARTREEMLEVFCPNDPAWRANALELGKRRWFQAAESLDSFE